VLEIENLHAGYDRGDVLRGISLRVDRGEVAGLLGANGVGKSTLALSISGLTSVSSGAIRFEGHSIVGLRPEKIVERGLVQVAQGRPIFRDLTVEENLRVGAYSRRARASYAENVGRVEKHFPILREYRRTPAGYLSGGEQQMLIIGRALMACPTMLVLDEPSLGLAPKIIAQIFATIRQLNAEGLTVLIAEQNARQVLATARMIYVMEGGRLRASGSSDEMRANPTLEEAYLGLKSVSGPSAETNSTPVQ
jgi:branched-chain amino acid transport system ATP-binding protein